MRVSLLTAIDNRRANRAAGRPPSARPRCLIEMPDEEVEASHPPCVTGEHGVAEALGENLPRAEEILATETPSDNVQHDTSPAEGKVGGAASIAAVDMIGQRTAERATHLLGSGVEDERDPVGVDGRAVHDEAARHCITHTKSLIHDADSHPEPVRIGSTNFIESESDPKFHAETQGFRASLAEQLAWVKASLNLSTNAYLRANVTA